MDVSIVIPLLNEQDSLNELTSRIAAELNRISRSHEIIFIDDGSTDHSFQKLMELKKTYPFIRIIRFRKNFGKSAALSEGFRRTKGDIVITMDADLQDDPAELPRLIEKIESGLDLVSGWKKKRHDPISKTWPSRFFNLVTRKLTGIKIHDFNCGLKAYRSEVIKAIPVYGELHRYLPVLAHWMGFAVGEMVVTHHARKHGKSKYGLRRFFSGFFDLLTVLFLTKYRQKPLHLFGFAGLVASFFGFAISLYLTIEWFMGVPLSRRPLLFLGILLLIVGVQFFSLGLMGELLTSTRDHSIQYAIRDEIE